MPGVAQVGSSPCRMPRARGDSFDNAMLRSLRSVNFALLLVAACSLATGLVLDGLGHGAPARVVWAAGALPVTIALGISVVRTLLRRSAGIDVLALLAIAFALVLGEQLTAAVIALMLASGRALEDYAAARAQREMTALLRHAPRVAIRFEGAEWRPVGLDSVRRGDRLLVRHGEVVPVDAALLGAADLDESALTGESVVRKRKAGETVLSGVLNVGPAFEMIAAETAENSTFSGIVRMVQAAQAERSPTARMADRYAVWFILLTLVVAGTGWLVAGDAARALAVLVVATPCPLILAVPVAIVSGMSSCARRGILVKGGGALERLAQADVLFFDKTGTLTGGQPRIVSIVPSPDDSAEQVLRMAAALAQASNHVVAEAVVVAAREREIALPVPADVEESPGAGVAGTVDGHVVRIGGFDYVAQGTSAAGWAQPVLKRMAFEGAAGVFVGIDGAMAGVIQLLDGIRTETPRALRLLRREGFRRLVMLTGDRRDIAETVGSILGGLEVLAEQTPAAKLSAIEGARRGGTVVMVGDGVNDAPALAAADIGVAMGARGAAASAEAADVVLLVDRLDKLVDAIRIARRSRRIAVQSMTIGMSLSMIAMAVAAIGLLPPLSGAILQEVIDVAVILNALRALRTGPLATLGRLSPADAQRLRSEHTDLGDIPDRLRALADGLPTLERGEALVAMRDLDQALTTRLLPHEQRDDADVYPQIGELIGGEDPMAAMSSTHREIFRLIRLVDRTVADLPPEGPDATAIAELQRLLYGLDAILRLHIAQEDELFHALGTATEARAVMA